MKFNENDWRQDIWIRENSNYRLIDEHNLLAFTNSSMSLYDILQKSSTMAYKYPAIPVLHNRVHRNCIKGVRACVDFLYNHIRHNNNGWYVRFFQPEKWRTLLDESSNWKTHDWLIKKWLHPFRTHTERMIFKISAAKIMCTYFLSARSSIQEKIIQSQTDEGGIAHKVIFDWLLEPVTMKRLDDLIAKVIANISLAVAIVANEVSEQCQSCNVSSTQISAGQSKLDYVCQCPDGRQFEVRSRKCVDVDECINEHERDSHVNEHTACVNGINRTRAKYICRIGFQNTKDRKECIESDVWMAIPN
ncbi:hypothetical protein GJ496_008223 [Pomphorhynchus laevis]|nr:hypothetical protein GJ496_008223 [Pomphorhynchus laevis]